MKHVFLKFDSLIRFIEEIVVGIGVLATVTIIFIDICMRHFTSQSLVWAEELVRYIVIWVTFLGGNLAIEKNVHVKMDIIHIKAPKKIAKAVVSITYIICIVGCAFLLYVGAKLTGQIFKLGQVSSAMPWFKMWLVNLSVPVFGIIGIKDYIQLLILNIRDQDEIVKEIRR